MQYKGDINAEPHTQVNQIYETVKHKKERRDYRLHTIGVFRPRRYSAFAVPHHRQQLRCQQVTEPYREDGANCRHETVCQRKHKGENASYIRSLSPIGFNVFPCGKPLNGFVVVQSQMTEDGSTQRSAFQRGTSQVPSERQDHPVLTGPPLELTQGA